MKPIDFAYELKRLTDGFSVQPLTDQRGQALYDTYGGNPVEVVRRAVGNLLLGDRYPNATQIAASFDAAKLWDHEARRQRQRDAVRGAGADAGQVLDSLSRRPGLGCDPRIPRFCLDAYDLRYNKLATPAQLASFYRRMDKDVPGMNLGAEAEVLEGWGDHWPDSSPIFPLAVKWKMEPGPAAEQASFEW